MRSRSVRLVPGPVLLLCVAAALPVAARAEPAQGGSSPLADDPTLIALAVSLACAPAPEGGEAPPPAPSAIPDDGPELELVATVRAKSLRFDEVPKVDVKFLGKGPRHTVWKTERVNLPMHPAPGVTYRDVAVRLTVSSTIAELSDLLAQAHRAARGIRLEPDDAPPAPAKSPAAAPSSAPAGAVAGPGAQPSAAAASAR